MTAILSISDLSKSYETDAGNFPVLKNLSFSIEEGEFVAIMGPSGSGKSTLLNILGCLDSPSEGKYFIKTNNVAQLNEKELASIRNQFIGFIFQGFNLLPRQTLLNNVALPLVYQGWEKEQRLAEAVKYLKQVGLEDKSNSLPAKISGGQQQRVAIARALVTQPSVLLADEPTGNLDSKTGKDILDLLVEINAQKRTILLVTHDIHVAKYARRLIYLQDGIISYDGLPATFILPA